MRHPGTPSQHTAPALNTRADMLAWGFGGGLTAAGTFSQFLEKKPMICSACRSTVTTRSTPMFCAPREPESGHSGRMLFCWPPICVPIKNPH